MPFLRCPHETEPVNRTVILFPDLENVEYIAKKGV